MNSLEAIKPATGQTARPPLASSASYVTDWRGTWERCPEHPDATAVWFANGTAMCQAWGCLRPLRIVEAAR